MKKILLIFLIGIALSSCGEQLDSRIDRANNAPNVKDNYGVNFKVIEIEGCEFYYTTGESYSGLTKVDCDCVPDKSGR